MSDMPEFKLDPESVSRAEKLSSRLMQDLRMVFEEGPSSGMRQELFSERRYIEQAEGVPINDVVTNVSQMAMEFAIARRWDEKILCLKLDDGELAPISMAEPFGGLSLPPYTSVDWIELWDRYGDFSFPLHRLWRDVLQHAASKEERIKMIDVRESEEGTQRNLERFLSYRFAGMKKYTEDRTTPTRLRWFQRIRNRLFGSSTRSPRGRGADSSDPPPPAVGSSGGLQVQVSCITPGLRIHVSPAYFINWVFFGSPTTPVTSYILPGRYIFAGDGSMLPTREMDNGVFCIPPTYHPSLAKF